MLQRIEGLLATAITRQTESTDTRLPIQHEDPVFERRRKRGQDHSTPLPDIDDVAEVSVPALLTFLEQELHIYRPDHVTTQVTQPVTPHINPQAAQAIRAYGGGQDPAPPPPPASTPMTSGLDDAGQAILHRAVADLKILRDAGISFLSIRRAGTFLEALVAAIQDTKAALP